MGIWLKPSLSFASSSNRWRGLHELDSKPLEKLHGRTPNIGMLFRNGGGEMYDVFRRWLTFQSREFWS